MTTTTKHIHHDVIIEWAKGATIQCRYNNDDTWEDVEPPLWEPQYQYRVKPVTKKYRVALMDSKANRTTTVETEECAIAIIRHPYFLRWLTDWIEYEV